jgi:flagellar biosynthesis protein FlhG
MVDSANQGRILYEKINKTVDRFLGGGLIFLGSVPFDRQITISNRYQTPIITSDPRASASLSYMRIARNISSWPTPAIPRGDIEFFFERFFEQLSHN